MHNQLGGLAKKATYLKQHRSDADGVLVLDAGDLLTPAGPHVIRGIVTPEDIAARAAIVARLEGTIGLQAVAVGERDLALGLKELRRLARAHHLRFLAANLVDARGKAPFEAGFVTETAGVKVGIFGVTDVPEGQRAPITQAGLTIQPALDAARREVSRLRGAGATVIVALAHVGMSSARKLMHSVEGIDLAIVGHTSTPPTALEKIGSGYVVEPYRQGKHLGEFLLHVVGNSPGFADRGQHRTLAEQLAAKGREYARLARGFKRETVARRREFYRASLERLRGEIERTCAAAKAPAPAVQGSWLEHRLVPMDKTIADDPPIAALIKQYKEEAGKRATAKAAKATKATPAPATH